MLACHLLGELATAANGVGQAGEVVSSDDLTDAGPQGLAEDADVEASAEQDDSDVCPVHPDRLREVAGALHVDVRTDDDQVLAGESSSVRIRATELSSRLMSPPTA